MSNPITEWFDSACKQFGWGDDDDSPKQSQADKQEAAEQVKKVETLMKGYGEQVCQLIDELVNLELYRRDFEFHAPIIPEDEEEQDELDMSA